MDNDGFRRPQDLDLSPPDDTKHGVGERRVLILGFPAARLLGPEPLIAGAACGAASFEPPTARLRCAAGKKARWRLQPRRAARTKPPRSRRRLRSQGSSPCLQARRRHERPAARNRLALFPPRSSLPTNLSLLLRPPRAPHTRPPRPLLTRQPLPVPQSPPQAPRSSKAPSLAPSRRRTGRRGSPPRRTCGTASPAARTRWRRGGRPPERPGGARGPAGPAVHYYEPSWWEASPSGKAPGEGCGGGLGEGLGGWPLYRQSPARARFREGCLIHPQYRHLYNKAGRHAAGGPRSFFSGWTFPPRRLRLGAGRQLIDGGRAAERRSGISRRGRRQQQKERRRGEEGRTGQRTTWLLLLRARAGGSDPQGVFFWLEWNERWCDNSHHVVAAAMIQDKAKLQPPAALPGRRVVFFVARPQ